MAKLNNLVIAWGIWTYGTFGEANSVPVLWMIDPSPPHRSQYHSNRDSYVSNLQCDRKADSNSIVSVYFWRSKTGQKSSDRVLFKLAFIAWETALVPAVSMLAAIILYSSSANKNGKINQYPYFLFVMTGKLYTVEFLRSLNVRTKLLAQMQTQDLGRVSLGNETWEQIKSTGTTSGDLLIPSTLAGPHVIPGSDLSLSQTVEASPQRVANTTPPPSQVDDHPFTSPQMLAQEQGMSTSSLGL
ncbi:hypothetical protein HWV62_678 [Athelia sp. TMB]|nr:hypothetical protein HWV62_678 [Athelia sp. TMB]